jgi:hypothetical protein
LIAVYDASLVIRPSEITTTRITSFTLNSTEGGQRYGTHRQFVLLFFIARSLKQTPGNVNLQASHIYKDVQCNVLNLLYTTQKIFRLKQIYINIILLLAHSSYFVVARHSSTY